MSEGDASSEHVGEPSGRRRLTDSEASELATAYVADVRTGRIHPPEWGARDTREEVENYIAHGLDPLRLLDAILQQETGDDEVTEDVGPGLLVGLIPDRRDLWEELDERCRRDPRWAAAARYAFTDEYTAAQLPPDLASMVMTYDPDFKRPLPSKERSRHKRRPSKRQDRHGRQR